MRMCSTARVRLRGVNERAQRAMLCAVSMVVVVVACERVFVCTYPLLGCCFCDGRHKSLGVSMAVSNPGQFESDAVLRFHGTLARVSREPLYIDLKPRSIAVQGAYSLHRPAQTPSDH